MNTEQRGRLLDLHRAATTALEAFHAGTGKVAEYYAADDAFRTFLLSLPTEDAA